LLAKKCFAFTALDIAPKEGENPDDHQKDDRRAKEVYDDLTRR
jgi:hypothetical protein